MRVAHGRALVLCLVSPTGYHAGLQNHRYIFNLYCIEFLVHQIKPKLLLIWEIFSFCHFGFWTKSQIVSRASIFVCN